MPPRKESPTKPWLLLIEFSCWADADAARQLLIEQGFGEITLRAKQQHPSDGNVAKWRSTAILREALGTREFVREDVENILLEHGYGNGNTLVTNLKRYGVIETVGREGKAYIYRFVDTDKLIPHDPKCNHCQPMEAIQCEAR